MSNIEPGILDILRDVQDRQNPFGPAMGFDEWRFEKQRGNVAPGFGMIGHLNTYSQAPTGPAARRSGMQGVGFNGRNPPDKDPFFGQQYGIQFGSEGATPSRYASERPFQPPPFIDDVDMRSVWWSPMEPVWPYGPPYQTRPREWQFPVGYNLNYIQPRMELMKQLRGMRSSWGLLSTVEATRMDQLLRLPWTIQRRDKPRASSKAVDGLRKFFKRPDGKLSYAQWSRKAMFDLFDIDAPYFYIDRDIYGKPRHIEVLDGGTIFPLIDDAGRRPTTELEIGHDGVTYIKRQPAYQQIIYGLPMINLSEDELIYAMMRPRPEAPMFGYSPVEQIQIEAVEGIRKTFYQGEFWRSGSMPELIVSVPDTWTPRQIAMYQAHFDALLSGQLSLKSKVRFVPGGMKPFDIKNASGESLWSQRDEFLARLICFAFSIPPTPFVRQMNRATAQTAQQTAQEEGLYPLMSWWKDDIMDVIIQDKLGYDDIEFVFLPRPEVDLEKQAQIHKIQLNNGISSINEVREELGREPIEDGDDHLLMFGSGAVKLEDVISGKAVLPGAPPPTNPGQNSSSKPNSPPAAGVPMRGPAKPHGSGLVPKPGDKLLKGQRYDEITDIANTAENPTKGQKKAGNYRKGKIWIHGLPISIETPKGRKRHGHEPDGSPWSSRMAGHYGYIRGTVGADGQQVDCCIGKHPKAATAFVVDQIIPETGKFDEHKVMLGYRSAEKAYEAYCDSNSDGKGPERCKHVTKISIPDLKSWLKVGDMHKPISEQGVGTIAKSDTFSSSTGHLWYDQGAKKKKKKRRSPTHRQGPRWLELRA